MKKLLERVFNRLFGKNPVDSTPKIVWSQPVKTLPGYYFWLYDPKTESITRFLGPRSHYGGGMYTFGVPVGCSLVRSRTEAGARFMITTRNKKKQKAA